MDRRALLAAAGTAAVGLAGCLGGPRGASSAEWSHEPGGRVDGVSRGTVFVHETFRDGGDGSLVALAADTDEYRWSYGTSNGYSRYTSLTVHDAVGSGAGELYALARDGAERWTRDSGSVYERPRLDAGTLYAGSDDGVVGAFDADDGAVRWRHEVTPDVAEGPPASTVEAVEDAVYVAAGRLLALDPVTGDVRWRFGNDDSSIQSAAVHDGAVFVRDGHAVRAVEDGVGGCSTSSESSPPGRRRRPRVRTGRDRAAPGRRRGRPQALDRRYRPSEPLDPHGDRVYAAGTAMYALDADDGEELWSERVAEGLLDRVQVATDGGVTGGEDHAVFVGQSDEATLRVAPDGEVTWSVAVPGDIRDFVVDGRVYAGSDGAIYALSVE